VPDIYYNICVNAAGKDLHQTNMGIYNFGECVEKCVNSDNCSALEWYPKGWNGSRCFHMNTGFGEDQAVKGSSGV